MTERWSDHKTSVELGFASRMLAWILSRAMGASVSFRVGGWKCLRDVVVKFNKVGAVGSVSIGEIRLSIRQSLVKLGVGFISRDPKLQVLVCDLEVVMRASSKISKKAKSRKSRKSGRGKWMVVANMARFLSVSVTELVVKTPKATVEVKELTLDLSKDGGSKPKLFVKLLLAPIFVHFGESRVSYDQSSMHGGSFPSNDRLLAMTERVFAPFSCEEFSLTCEFGHDREAGVVVRNVDIATGDVSINLNEELLLQRKGEDAFSSTDVPIKAVNESGTAEKPVKTPANLAIMKYASMFPEKLSFVLPRLDMKFVHREVGLMLENNIMGIQLKGTKSRSFEDVGESTRVDVQMEFSEIHLLKDGGISVVEILKLDVVSSVYIPLQNKYKASAIELVLFNPASPIRSEVDVKLGGTQCNLVMTRLHPWMHLLALRKKKMVLRGESTTSERSHSSDHKAFMWTSTISAPEMTIVLYDLNGSPLYCGCSQSSHVFANNISSTGTVVHMELGEFNLNMSDEYRECLKESLFGVETNMGSLIYIAKISVDWGKKDMDSPEDSLNYKTVLSVDVTGMGVHLTFRRIGSLMSTALSFKRLLKSLSGSGKKPHNRVTKSSKPSGKGIQLIKFNLEKCSLNICGEVGLENSVVPDPKRANYGSQGGRIVVSVSADGTPRTATITPTAQVELKKLKYSLSLDIFHLNLSMNKEKQSTQMGLERATAIYQEHLEDSNLPGARVTLLDMQNAKFVRRSGGLKEIAVCSLFSATDISVRWEPDVHIALVELGLHLKLLLHNQKLQELAKGDLKENGQGNEISMESVPLEKRKKKESIFAIDVEMLNISAEVGDGVETTVQVQSIFSENARIGVLFEGLMLNFNNARIFRSSRMQVSRIPNASRSASTAKHEIGTTWDWVIQALDVHICMPYRLELRAIDDSVEEMLRALKLVTSAKTKLLFPNKEEKSKAKGTSSSKIGRIRFCIKKLTADIEEQPIQGWFDEHYQLLKKEACELAVRLNFIDELISKGGKSRGVAEKKDSLEDGKIHFNGEEIDVEDTSAVQKLQEDIYKLSFRSYYQACQNLVQSQGSRACSEGFQGGFKLSTARSSLFSVSATELDISLTRIEGGDSGMIEILQKLDPVCRAHSIPFSRLYGSNINLHTGSLVVRIRNYTYPLFAATSGSCEGRVILAQQATCFQPQIHQNVYIGRWRKVRLLRSASGTTPPMKTYSDLPLHFQKAEISYGVGFEPALADISYAFTVALRRANLSIRNPSPDCPPLKKEKSLPWWDEMRNYIHGNTSLYFSESQWNILASTDPYEKSDKLQIRSGYMELQQSDGRVYCFAKDFRILLSSLESLLKNSNLKCPSGFSSTFIEAPAFSLEVIMEWECDSGNPLNHYLFAFPSEGVPREKVYDPFRSTSLSLRWNLLLRPSLPIHDNQSSLCSVGDQGVLDAAGCGAMKPDSLSVFPTLKLGPHDLAWVLKFWSLNYYPPHKLRSFSRWPRFGIPRVPRSGNLSLDKVMTEFMFRVDATPACIKHMPLDDDDPAKGLTFSMNKLKYELYYGRGKQKYTSESKRDTLDLVYQGLDLHMPKAFINRDDNSSAAEIVKMTRKTSQSASTERSSNDKTSSMSSSMERQRDDGFLLSSDYFTIRRQSPKADPDRLLAWQESGRRNLEMTYVRSEFENGSGSDDHTRSDPSDDDGYNVVIADNCQRIFVYGLKLLWTLENRDAVWSWVGGISKAFESPKPSPSRQYAQRKLLEDSEVIDRTELPQDDNLKSPLSHGASSSSPQHVRSSKVQVESPPSSEVKVETLPSSSFAKLADIEDIEGEGTRHFMVNVVEPQFNLHSEDANYKEALSSPALTLDGGCRRLRGEGEPRFRLSAGHIGEKKSFLAMCLVGRFEKRVNSPDSVFSLATNIWKAYPWIKVSSMGDSTFLFRFLSAIEADCVLWEGVRKALARTGYYVSHRQRESHSSVVRISNGDDERKEREIPSEEAAMFGELVHWKIDDGETIYGTKLADGAQNCSNNHMEDKVSGNKMIGGARGQRSAWGRERLVMSFNDWAGAMRGAAFRVVPSLRGATFQGRFLLAAVSGRVLARSFHSVLSIGYEVIKQALGGGNVQIRESQPEMTWNRMEYSVMLEHVQAHVAPTDVDPGAGLQWLPKIRRSSPKVKRTGALLERVFMPCDMYFRYTRHKGGTADLKVKPLKELSFNSHNITATMTSRQFQVMLDVLTNLLFARLPKPRKVSLSYPAGDDEDVEEEADEVVPDGVEEVELARVNLEQKERAQKLIQDDIRKLSLYNDASADRNSVKEDDLWIITGGRSILVQRLKKELVNAQKSRKAASASLRMALQKAAQLRLMEKEKNKSPSCAMRISLQINKVVWSMLVDGRSFAEAEINDMIYDFDRDYKDVGVAKFTTKYFVVRNCLPNAKSDMLLSAWNAPAEWGKNESVAFRKVMLRVDAKQGAPKDGNYPLELFQVEIYPLKIHLTETMYRMMWEYFFPEEEQDSQRRQEVWKFSTTAGSRRARKGSSMQEAPMSSSHLTKDPQVSAKSSNSALPVTSANQFSSSADSSQVSKLQNLKANIVCGSTPELRRTSSFDRTWEENVAESVADELMLQMHSSSATSSTSGPFAGSEQPDEGNRNKSKESKLIKSGRSSHEEKKVGKAQDEKKSRPRRMREFHNIKISQVELLVTYEGSRFAVSDLRLLMDTFHRVEFTGTWRRLFSRVKKHIIWGVLKSVTGMQGKKFKDKAHNQKEACAAGVPDIDINLSDSDGGSAGKSEQNPLSWPKRPAEGAGDGFVTSIKGLFNSQRRKAKAFVLRTMRGEAENEITGDWSESEAEFSPFARQLTITKAKKLIRRHTKKFRSRGPKGLSSQQRESLPSSPRETTPFESDSSDSLPYEDFHE
ncbi:hypothetical protein RND71_027814 [Anisodus tanguticus]|uniref:FMP27/BLTP2/Hobbit GFWDK motif-containing RBG unit domain-containing protein n=1 Tax=Anisodus tanguticus TaxID=243964 RepID=A0AAE1RJN8_9SOLA|nr:hypothetical protein RND71_027814 [Anisodus tanguticus]